MIDFASRRRTLRGLAKGGGAVLDIGFGGAVLAGLLSFLSPCVLPMVPFHLCYMAGLSMAELRGEVPAAGVQRRLIAAAVAFALGVTTIFVLLGLGATALGRAFAAWREPLGYLAAAVLLAFGLHFLGVVRIPFLYREARLRTRARAAGLPGAYLTGLAFGFGWTPCAGPALAAILLIASGTGDQWRGGALLLAYGLAMTLPFVIAAAFARPFLRRAARHRGHLRHAERAMGAMLIVFAVLIATNSVSRIAQWMLDSFDWSGTIV